MRKLFSFILILALLFQTVNVLAVDTSVAESEEADNKSIVIDVINESIIVKKDYPFYYKNGVKKFFDTINASYIPMYANEDFGLSVDILSQMLDFTYEYDKNTQTISMNRGDIQVTARIGEDAIFKNGKGIYIAETVKFTGKKILLPLRKVADAFGYYVDVYEQTYIISENGIISDNYVDYESIDELLIENVVKQDFSDIKVIQDGKYILPNYGVVDSKNTPNVSGGYVRDAELYFYIDATNEEYAGLKMRKFAFDPLTQQYDIVVNVRSTKDYSGNNAVAIINALDKDDNIIGTKRYDLGDVYDTWTKTSITYQKSDYFEGDVASLSIILGTAKDDGDIAGQLHIKEIDITKTTNVSKYRSEIEVYSQSLFFNGYFNEGFETMGTPSYQAWKTPAGYGISSEYAFSGEKSAYVDATQDHMAVIWIGRHEDAMIGRTKEFVVKANVYATEDYIQNMPRVIFQKENNGAFVNMTYGVTSDKVIPGKWTEMTFRFPAGSHYAYSDGFRLFESFRIGFGTTPVNVTEQTPAKGRIYFDNVRFMEESCFDENTAISVIPENRISWYVIGDEIVYRAIDQDLPKLDYFTDVAVEVTNLDNEVVYEDKVSVGKFKTEGWRWIPTEEYQTGILRAEFSGVRPDGTKSRFEIIKTISDNGEFYQTGNTKRQFAVVKKQTKPQSERSLFAGINIQSTPIEYGELLDKIGFGATRYHYVLWGDHQLRTGSHLGIGRFDWEYIDAVMSAIPESTSLMVNIYGSPQWAIPAQHQSDTGGLVFGGRRFNSYGIENQAIVEDYMNAFLERYGHRIDIIEFWNEPGPISAFWLDSKYGKDYLLIEMLKTTKKCVDEYNKKNKTDIKIAFAGFMVNSETWINNFMTIDENIGDYYDILSIHGSTGAVVKLAENLYADEEINLGDKPWINSETYSYSAHIVRDPETGARDYNVGLVEVVMNYLMHLKAGASQMYDFIIGGTTPEPDIATTLRTTGTRLSQWNHGVRYYDGHVEPEPITTVEFTMFDLFGKELSYESEYDLKNGQAAVVLKSDGKPLIAVWNRDGIDTPLDEKLYNCLTAESVIVDFEGHTINDKSATLRSNKLYWITGADESKLKEIDSVDDMLSADNVAPYYACKKTISSVSNTSVTFEELEVAKNEFTMGKLFDTKTYKVINNQINWIDTQWKWVSSEYDKPEGFGVKFAVSYDKEGLQLMVDVSDKTPYINNKDSIMSSYWEFDGLQFAIDTDNSGDSSRRIECAVSETILGNYFRKDAAPSPGELILTNYTKSGENVEKHIEITQTDTGKLYKLFLPTSEMWPMSFENDSKYMRFSLLVNNNDGYGRMGYMEWGSGIGGAKNPIEYGALRQPAVSQ